MTWKQQQRALTERAKEAQALLKHKDYNVFSSITGAAYVKAPDGSFRRLNSKRHER